MNTIYRMAAWCGVLLGGLSLAVGGEAERPAAVLRAGAATSNITPFLGGDIVGGFHPFPSQQIHDELWARCLVIDNGEQRVAFVVLDLPHVWTSWVKSTLLSADDAIIVAGPDLAETGGQQQPGRSERSEFQGRSRAASADRRC